MQRTYQYRLYPSREQQDALNVILRQSCLLYNEALEHLGMCIKRLGCRCPTWISGAASVRIARRAWKTSACLMLRLCSSFCAASTRRLLHSSVAKAGETPGFPRFKPAQRFRSVEYRHGDGCKLTDMLATSPSSCTAPSRKAAFVISCKAGNRWFVSFQGDDGEVVPDS